MGYRPMLTALALAAAFGLVGTPSTADEPKSKGTRFWNLTGETITKLELAPAGTTTFGQDQCKNDKDGAVDNDERLRVVDIPTGTYDARLTDAKGRVCVVADLDIKADGIFSVEAEQMKNCKP